MSVTGHSMSLEKEPFDRLVISLFGLVFRCE